MAVLGKSADGNWTHPCVWRSFHFQLATGHFQSVHRVFHILSHLLAPFDCPSSEAICE